MVAPNKRIARLKRLRELRQNEAEIQAQRDDLLAFGRAVNQEYDSTEGGPRYKDGPPHKRLAAALEEVEAGETSRLLVGMPPQYGKSLMASILFVAWYLGRNWHRNKNVGFVSYNKEQAVKISKRLRALIRSPQVLRIQFIAYHLHSPTCVRP